MTRKATGPLGNEVRASDLRALVVAARNDHGNREVKHLQSSRVLIAVQQECVYVCVRVRVLVRQISSCGSNSYCVRKKNDIKRAGENKDKN